MAESAQLRDNRQREVFIGIKAGHNLRCLVVGNLRFYLIPMCPVVGPGVDKVFRSQGWICVEQVSFSRTQAASVNKEPHRDPRTDDTWLATGNSGCADDAWEGVTQVANNRLEQLCFFGAGQSRHQFFGFL